MTHVELFIQTISFKRDKTKAAFKLEEHGNLTINLALLNACAHDTTLVHSLCNTGKISRSKQTCKITDHFTCASADQRYLLRN